MNDELPSRRARFTLGDQVRVIGPSAKTYQAKTGIVSEIVEAGPDNVFRYRVTFDDGAKAVFFGFELVPEKLAS